MLETDTMSTGYAYRDNKTHDAANFGIFKQNWHMLRNSCSWFTGQCVNDWNNGSRLNGDLGAELYCRHATQSHYGEFVWFTARRNGESGLNNPNTSDINKCRTAVYWIKGQLEGTRPTSPTTPASGPTSKPSAVDRKARPAQHRAGRPHSRSRLHRPLKTARRSGATAPQVRRKPRVAMRASGPSGACSTCLPRARARCGATS
ncbi:hypothetical protein GCM10029992_38240 [Glycomyces albus]